MEYLASAAQTAGSAATTAGQGIANAASGLLQNPQASYLQGLGQQVPQGVQLAGPSSTFQGVGGQLGGGALDFGRGLLQGYTGVQGAGEAGGFSPQGIGSILGGLGAGQGGGGGQQLGGLLQMLQRGMQGGPAARVLPQGPGQAQSRGLIAQLFAGI